MIELQMYQISKYSIFIFLNCCNSFEFGFTTINNRKNTTKILTNQNLIPEIQKIQVLTLHNVLKC